MIQEIKDGELQREFEKSLRKSPYSSQPTQEQQKIELKNTPDSEILNGSEKYDKLFEYKEQVEIFSLYKLKQTGDHLLIIRQFMHADFDKSSKVFNQITKEIQKHPDKKLVVNIAMNPGGFPEFSSLVLFSLYPEAFPIAITTRFKRSRLFDLISQSLPEMTLRDQLTGNVITTVNKLNKEWYISKNPEWSTDYVIAEDKKNSVAIINDILKLGGFKKEPTKIIVVAANTCVSASSILAFALKSFGVGAFVSLVPLDLEQICISGGGGSFHTATAYMASI